jgi:hypothetical protein
MKKPKQESVHQLKNQSLNLEAIEIEINQNGYKSNKQKTTTRPVLLQHFAEAPRAHILMGSPARVRAQVESVARANSPPYRQS